MTWIQTAVNEDSALYAALSINPAATRAAKDLHQAIAAGNSV